MAYKDTYCAYAILPDGSRLEWNGLRKSQAKWRFHWIGRNHFNMATKEWGWQREWESAQ